MAEYQLYCFAQSGNAYRAALMLNLIGADWEPIYVDFFKAAVQRTADYRDNVNEMGEAPVLQHRDTKLSQSGVILFHLAEQSGKFLPRDEAARLEALRWIIFDNQKIGGNLGPYRFLRNFAKPLGEPAVLEFLKGRAHGALAIVDKRLSHSPYLLGAEPTIADVSMTSYLYYPSEEFGFDIAAQYPNIGAWLGRMKALPRWGHPYDLMPGYPLPA
ncbi:MAG: glutathione S-transferase family protein [Xanthobacteraceae bacterium]|jgi:glutathione S-transferase